MQMLQGSKIFIFFCAILIAGTMPVSADNGAKTSGSIPLFAEFLEKTPAMFAGERSRSGRPTTSAAATASRIAQVAINTDAIDTAKIAQGDILAIGLFDNRSLEAVIDKVDVSNKTTTIRGEINGSNQGYIVTTVHENKTLTVIELPAEGYQYKVIYDNTLKTHFLYKTPLSELDILEGAPSFIPPPQNNDSRSLHDINTEIVPPAATTTIDVMVVYTPAAASWASSNATSITNVINQAMNKAQLALTNSNTSINMQLVHSAQVAYTEAPGDTGYSTDLNNLTNGSIYTIIDDVPVNVHTLRDQYGADLVAMFTLEHITGGVGWLLQDRDGRPANAFCIVRVQQAHFSFTHIHEMGHNMGAHHHKDQNYQKGPTPWWNWAANTWSAGWRWEDSNAGSYDGYCTLMSYQSGFPDGLVHYRTAYFSNPAIYGDSADGDNARTLREVRHVIAAYRPTAGPECTIDADCSGGEVCVDEECVECADDGDCTDGVCSNNACVECIDGGDCIGGTCESNVCIPYECNVDADCIDSGEVCSNHYCVECANDDDCTDGDVCSNNACVECDDDGDCTGDDVCSGSNTCVECDDDGDCTDGTCESNVCIPYECTVDADCTGAEVCSDYTCVECDDNNDCDDGDFCNGAERCSGEICFSGTDPCTAGQLCNEENDTCIEPAECENDDDCGVGVCVIDVCVECRIDNDCSGGEVCSEYNICVECDDNGDCPGGEVCSNYNTCVECAKDDDCPDGACMDNVCVDCLENDDCVSNICLTNKCIDCMTWVDCTNGDVCLDNFCVECADNNDCRDGICLDNMCTECVVDADCERGACINYECAVPGSVQIDKFTVKAGKNGKGDSLKFSGLMDADIADFNDAWLGNIIVTLSADTIPDPETTTFTFPIKNDSLKNFKYKSPKIKLLDKTAPVTSLQIDTIKGKMKFSGKSLDLTGLSCPITVKIQIGMYTAEIVLDEAIVNGTKKLCPPELMEGL